ncbi:MAG: MFS transporter [Candidatus Woesearchaeota archaeon]
MALQDEIRRELEKSHSINEVKNNLIKRGYLESDIESILGDSLKSKSNERSKNDNLLTIKELFDRIGYGFASQQFINILFMLSGASLFLIGFTNSIKTVATTLLSGLINELKKVKYIGKTFISSSGIIYGFSFFGMTLALVLKNPLLFAVSLLIGSLGIIAHGDLFLEFSRLILKHEKRSEFLRFISYFGILITATSLLIAGLVMEWIPINGKTIDLAFIGLPDITFKIFGYLLMFEITAIMFILSGYFVSLISESKEILNSDMNLGSFLRSYFHDNAESYKIFAKNNKIYLLMIATVLTTVLQVIGNSYYGIFIYEKFKNDFFGGFLNVALVFVAALVASLIGTVLTKKFAKSLGEAPMLVFGTLLIALAPLTMYFNPTLQAVTISIALSVIGGATVGIAQGLLAERLMNESEVKSFFSSLGFVSIVPIIFIGLLGAIISQAIGLSSLFLYLGVALACVVMPIYFIIVLIVDSEYRKAN